MARRYQLLGCVRKKKGLQMWEFHFDYGLLRDDSTEVFVIKKSKRRRRPRKEILKG